MQLTTGVFSLLSKDFLIRVSCSNFSFIISYTKFKKLKIWILCDVNNIILPHAFPASRRLVVGTICFRFISLYLLFLIFLIFVGIFIFHYDFHYHPSLHLIHFVFFLLSLITINYHLLFSLLFYFITSVLFLLVIFTSLQISWAEKQNLFFEHIKAFFIASAVRSALSIALIPSVIYLELQERILFYLIPCYSCWHNQKRLKILLLN